MWNNKFQKRRARVKKVLILLFVFRKDDEDDYLNKIIKIFFLDCYCTGDEDYNKISNKICKIDN